MQYTKLQNCSLNQFAIVVTRRVSDRVSTVLGSYKCSSEKQVQKKNTAAVEQIVPTGLVPQVNSSYWSSSTGK